MQINRIQKNNNPSFNAKLKINDAQRVLCDIDIDFLRSEAAKIGSNKDIIKVKLNNYDYGDTYTWAEQGLGWMTDKEMDSVNVSVKSIFNKKSKTEDFTCVGHNIQELSEDIIGSLKVCFEEFADKLKK